MTGYNVFGSLYLDKRISSRYFYPSRSCILTSWPTWNCKLSDFCPHFSPLAFVLFHSESSTISWLVSRYRLGRRFLLTPYTESPVLFHKVYAFPFFDILPFLSLSIEEFKFTIRKVLLRRSTFPNVRCFVLTSDGRWDSLQGWYPSHMALYIARCHQGILRV